MSMTGRPCVGIVYKTKEGNTFTEWYHAQSFSYIEPPVQDWVNDKLWWKDKIIKSIDIMCVVRAK